jgi:hypothetical protein
MKGTAASIGMLALALGATQAGAVVMGGGSSTSDCYVTFEGITLTGPNVVDCRDGDPCDADGTANQVCDFAIAVCVNQPPCTPVTVSRIQNTRAFNLPSGFLPATTSTCAAATSIKVKLKGKGQKAGKKAIRTIARTSGRPKRDVDHFRLRCQPGGGGGGGSVPGDRLFSVDGSQSEFVSSVTGSDISSAINGALTLRAGTPDANGVASLTLTDTAYLGVADIGGGFNCFRLVAANDPGKLDCDGGTPVGVKVTQDSMGTGNATDPVLSLEQGAAGQAGDGYVPVKVTSVTCGGPQPTPQGCPGGMPANAGECASKVDFSKGLVFDVALTTGEGTSEVTNPRQGGAPISQSKTGAPFSCTGWSENGPGTLVMPLIGLDIQAAGNIDTVNSLSIGD